MLHSVLFWLLFLPLLFLSAIAETTAHEPYFQNVTWESIAAGSTNPGPLIAVLFFSALLLILLLWGVASVALVGKRLVQNRAGRARTSFGIVRRQAAHAVAHLFFTDILRWCTTILWGLLLLVPGIIYSVRTFFFFIAVVCEGKGGRSALEFSKKAVRGQTGKTFAYLFGLAAVIFSPLLLLDTAIIRLVSLLLPQLLFATYLVSAYLQGSGILLFLLSSMALFAELRHRPSLVVVD